MNITDPEFTPFLLRAKRATYAAGDQAQVASSRSASHDLAYHEGNWSYLDTYLGGFAFIGEEAVWCEGTPLWGMNYYGTMTVQQIPEGFPGFLKLALRQAPIEVPYRGPASLQSEDGHFSYTCRWEGDLARFKGEEAISLDGQVIYILNFHGGQVI